MIKRLHIYFKERYPIIPRIILGLIVFLEIHFIVLLNNGVKVVLLLVDFGPKMGSFKTEYGLKDLTTYIEKNLEHPTYFCKSLEELDEYNKDYTLVSKIRYYASPNTGIQSIFIGIFIVFFLNIN